MSDNKQIYWASAVTKNCQACGRVLHSAFYDARLKDGVWGIVCDPCFQIRGVGLGVGRGQRYTKQADGRWLKTGG